jgi:Fe2+ or Zn2+ uptake regulation protein
MKRSPAPVPRSAAGAAADAEIGRRLAERGLRATAPRRILLTFLERRGEHLSAGEILDGLRRAGRPMSVATLYQNLRALSRHGLLTRVADTAGGTARYDINPSPHHHLICERCGRMIDVTLSAPVTSNPVLADGAEADWLRGWRISRSQVEFRGLCPTCRRPQRNAAKPKGRAE